MGSPLPEGWFKVNVDASIKIEDQVAGLGMVVADTNGNMVAAVSSERSISTQCCIHGS